MRRRKFGFESGKSVINAVSQVKGICPARRPRRETRRVSIALSLVPLLFSLVSSAAGQGTATGGPAGSSIIAPPGFQEAAHGKSRAAPPITLTLQDAIERARAISPQLTAATAGAEIAHEDTIQARAALLPWVNSTFQYLNTQGNGVLPSGRYVTNDGIHVYRAWGVLRQALDPNLFMRSGYHRAEAAEALTNAQAEIARRGLEVSVTRSYYAMVVAQRRYGNARESLGQARRFLTISQDLEQGGEVAHSDVIKFQILFDQQRHVAQEASLAIEITRLELAVMVFPDFNENFTVVDDLDAARALPGLGEVQQLASRNNPQIRAASVALRQASLDVSIARAAYLPSLTLDLDYGIEANAFALRSPVSAAPGVGRLPNLGYFATVTLNLPIWDWGTLRSKVRQADARRRQASVELTLAQRQALSTLHALYAEAETARVEVDILRSSADSAAESLRLNTLRYQAGEATVLELVDAQNTHAQTRSAYDEGRARYRLASANLQAFTGGF